METNSEFFPGDRVVSKVSNQKGMVVRILEITNNMELVTKCYFILWDNERQTNNVQLVCNCYTADSIKGIPESNKRQYVRDYTKDETNPLYRDIVF